MYVGSAGMQALHALCGGGIDEENPSDIWKYGIIIVSLH